MKRVTFLWISVVAATIPTTVLAETEEIRMTPEYLREHPKDWSLTVTGQKDSLIQFTVVRIVPERMYFVAHFEVRHAGKRVASSDTPSFGKKGGNTFYFSTSAEAVPESIFNLGETYMGGRVSTFDSRMVSGQEVEQPTICGETDYEFKLSDFVRDLPNSKLKN